MIENGSTGAAAANIPAVLQLPTISRKRTSKALGPFSASWTKNFCSERPFYNRALLEPFAAVCANWKGFIYTLPGAIIFSTFLKIPFRATLAAHSAFRLRLCVTALTAKNFPSRF
jgi:hypothetical protein